MHPCRLGVGGQSTDGPGLVMAIFASYLRCGHQRYAMVVQMWLTEEAGGLPADDLPRLSLRRR